MAPRKPKVGDTVRHHGRDHEITLIDTVAVKVDGKAALVSKIVFENDGYAVQVRAEDAEATLLHPDGHWYLVGRVLSRNERVLCEVVFGSWPKAENHVTLLPALDSLDHSTIEAAAIIEVLKRRKAMSFIKNLAAVRAAQSEGKTVTEIAALIEWDKAALASYAPALLAQCAELRELRKGARS